LSEFFSFPLSVSFLHGSSYSYITWGMNIGPIVGGCSSETSSHPINEHDYTFTLTLEITS
jgi:hypothetical protein